MFVRRFITSAPRILKCSRVLFRNNRNTYAQYTIDETPTSGHGKNDNPISDILAFNKAITSRRGKKPRNRKQQEKQKKRRQGKKQEHRQRQNSKPGADQSDVLVESGPDSSTAPPFVDYSQFLGKTHRPGWVSITRVEDAYRKEWAKQSRLKSRLARGGFGVLDRAVPKIPKNGPHLPTDQTIVRSQRIFRRVKLFSRSSRWIWRTRRAAQARRIGFLKPGLRSSWASVSRKVSTPTTFSVPGSPTFFETLRILHREEHQGKHQKKPSRFVTRVPQAYSVHDAEIYDKLSNRQQNRFWTKMDAETKPVAILPSAPSSKPVLITLDAFDTLFTPKEPITRQYLKVMRRYGIHASELEISESFSVAYKAQTNSYPNYGFAHDMSPKLWWSMVIEHTVAQFAANGDVPEQLLEDLYSRFSSSAGYKLFPDTAEFLSIIGTSFQAQVWAPRRTMLGIVSNSDPRVRDILSSFGIRISPSLFPPRFALPSPIPKPPNFGPAHFAFAALSYEAGFSKPQPEIYDHAIKLAQVALDRMPTVARLTRSHTSALNNINSDFHHMHVGDDLKKDVLPALKRGWDAILIDRSSPEAVRQIEHEGQSITVINNLVALRHLVTDQRLGAADGPSSWWKNTERPVKKTYTPKEKLRGTHYIPHPGTDPEQKLMTLR